MASIAIYIYDVVTEYGKGNRVYYLKQREISCMFHCRDTVSTHFRHIPKVDQHFSAILLFTLILYRFPFSAHEKKKKKYSDDKSNRYLREHRQYIYHSLKDQVVPLNFLLMSIRQATRVVYEYRKYLCNNFFMLIYWHNLYNDRCQDIIIIILLRRDLCNFRQIHQTHGN